MAVYTYNDEQLKTLKREAVKLLKTYDMRLHANVVKRITPSAIQYDVRIGDHALVFDERDTPHGRWHFVSIQFLGNTDSFAEQEARKLLASKLKAIVAGEGFKVTVMSSYDETGKDILAAAARLVEEFAKNKN